MITKAIVEQIDRSNPYIAKVRIPVFNKAPGVVGATPTNQLYTATIATLPNCNPNIRVGDIVYIDFEDNYIDKPVIIGHLYNGISNKGTLSSLKVDSLESTVITKLPADTTIGNTLPSDFVNVQNTRSNLQGQIDALTQSVNADISNLAITSAPKPWIDGTNWITVVGREYDGRRYETRKFSCSKAIATINLLYIQIEGLFGGYAYEGEYFSLEFNKSTPTTESSAVFESYFNKQKTPIAIQPVFNIAKRYSDGAVVSASIRSIDTEWENVEGEGRVKNGYYVQGTPNSQYIGWYIWEAVRDGQLVPGTDDIYEPLTESAPIGFLFALSD